MFLKFIDRTWILLGKLIDRGEKEGMIKHIEIPLKEWKMLVSEWSDLNSNIQKTYIKRFKVVTGAGSEGITAIRPDFIMDEDFVDKWVEGEYTVFFREVKLILQMPDQISEVESKATAETEINSDKG